MKLIIACAALLILGCAELWSGQGSEWVPLFDGRTLDGWRAGENPGTFSVTNGEIVAHGPRSHLFLTGPLAEGLRDFELAAEVMTKPGSNSGIFIHTRFQQEGWPSQGYEVQVNNSHTDWRRTASVYAVRDVREAAARDNEWFELRVVVRGRRVQTIVDGRMIVDYTEPADSVSRLTGGTVALQGHDPDSEVRYRNIRLRRLSN